MSNVSPGPSAATWDQDVPVGGEDALGQTAPIAQAVAVQGIVTVRNVPTMGAASNSVTMASGDTKRLLGRSPQRRAVTIMATCTGHLNIDQGLADSGVGLPVAANTPIVIQSAGEIWFRASSAGEIGFWSELDLG